MPEIKNIAITPEILKLIADIDEFKGRWTVIETMAPERLASLRRVATIESIGSSTRIEGSKLSDAEVEKLLSNLQTKSFASRDEQEVAGYADAMDMIFEVPPAITLTENHIKQLHGVLLKYSTKDQDHRGEYKKVTNHVEAFGPDGKSLGVVFETATPFETPLWMKEIVDWYNASVQEETHHPLILIGIFIVVFLAIHPFRDGNGRLSRVLTTLLLLRAGYAYVPYSSMEGVIEANKDSYYLALRRTQGTIRTDNQNWEPWLTFLLKSMVKQKDNLAAKVKQEQSLRSALPALSRQILEMAKTRGEITIKEIEEATGANRNTIKAHMKKLVGQQYLVQIGKGRGARYMIK
ncbi:MAG: Fic family protein [Alphaproteobacteria bacterium]|nr:Fic family protein [Alphaproteobacteria bacterium]